MAVAQEVITSIGDYMAQRLRAESTAAGMLAATTDLLGVIVVGAAVEHRTRRAAWTITYLLGGVGGIAATSAWHPADLGGGSSDAVAALVGALLLLLAAENHDHDHHHEPGGRRLWAVWPAQVYCIFFAGYLTAFDLGGVWWSMFAGDATVAAFVIARRALTPTALTRACLVLVGAGRCDHDR